MSHEQASSSGFLDAVLRVSLVLCLASSRAAAVVGHGDEPRGPDVPAKPSSVQFKLSEVEAQSGKPVNVPVLVKAGEPLSMVAFSVEYDPQVLDLVGPVISSEVVSILAATPGAQWNLTWFSSQEEGWVQVSLVVDYQGRDEFTLPPGEFFEAASLSFQVRPDAPEGRFPLSFTSPDRAHYQSHFQNGKGAVYNSARRHGSPFTPENQFSDPVEPDLQDGAVVIGIIGDVGIFVRGDANVDRRIDLSDSVSVLEYLFLGRQSLSCMDAADANDDGQIDISDPVMVLDYLFLGSTASSTLSAKMVKDETPDLLDCAYY